MNSLDSYILSTAGYSRMLEIGEWELVSDEFDQSPPMLTSISDERLYHISLCEFYVYHWARYPSQVVLYYTLDHTLESLVMRDDMEAIKFLLDRCGSLMFCCVNQMMIPYYAAAAGQIRCLEYLYRFGFHPTKDDLMVALSESQVECARSILRWLPVSSNDMELMDRAVSGPDPIPCIELLWGHGWQKSGYLYMAACFHGKRLVIEFAIANHIPFEDVPFERVAWRYMISRDNLICLQLLKDAGCPYIESRLPPPIFERLR